jgi:ketosteroid isomerase-like protein
MMMEKDVSGNRIITSPLALTTVTRLRTSAILQHLRVCVLVVEIMAATLVSGVDLGAQRAPKSDQDTLVELERDWNDAFERKDIAFISAVLADEFMATYEDGSQGDKARELSRTEAFNEHVDSSVQEDFLVKIYGDTAVVSFAQHLVGPKQGVATTVFLRYVDVFVWRDGRWQCVSSQSTKVTSR